MSSFSRAIPEDATPFIILGADAVLAAQPASPVQLAHACQALGFELAAPATWGDELIAESCLEQLAVYEHSAAVMCSCPLVTERLTRSSALLEPFMLTFVSPPVATARYLRAVFSGRRLHITYAGACPGADDESIDARMLPAKLLDAFVDNGISVTAQPNCFDALVPLDRRRFYSLPGGVPSHAQVERLAQRTLVELNGDDAVLELAQQLMEQSPALLDLAAPLGCACAGAGAHGARGHAGAGLLTLEPPRARQKVLDPSLKVDVAQTLAEACELQWSAEEPAVLEVHLAADSAPVQEESQFEDAPAAPYARADAPAAAPLPRRRQVVVRPVAALPRHANENGALVPRASLAILRRALLRMASRRARRQPRVARGRRERAADAHETPTRGPARTPRSLAIPGAADLPRPVPPPPARHRPRSVPGLGALLVFSLVTGNADRVERYGCRASSAPVITNCVATAASSSPMMRVITRIPV
jgi:hypothetical protein